MYQYSSFETWGIASNGHRVSFPQEINQPAKIFPRLPTEIKIIQVRKQNHNKEGYKDFKVRRYVIQNALIWLKGNNPAYSDIEIDKDRLSLYPIDGEMPNLQTVVIPDQNRNMDKGPAFDQINLESEHGESNSGVLLPDLPTNMQEKIQNVVTEVTGKTECVTTNRQGNISIPWPTLDNNPVSEFTTRNFFSMAFPNLFPYGEADFYANRPRTCHNILDWADHLLWYKDGRFAQHSYFKFIVHNMVMRKKSIERGSYIFHQQLGDENVSMSELKEKLQKGDCNMAKKISYFSASLRGTSQYWATRAKELRALIQFKVNNGGGLPSYFATAICAEFYFKPLRRLLSIYLKQANGTDIDLNNKTQIFNAVQQNSHIVAKYFDLRTHSYFKTVMGPLFGVNTYWYRQEFAKSRGMVHWHGLCWREDREPHNLLYEAVQNGLSEPECAKKLSEWASQQLGIASCWHRLKRPTSERSLASTRRDSSTSSRGR